METRDWYKQHCLSLAACLTLLWLFITPPPVLSFSRGFVIAANFSMYCNRRANQRFPIHFDANRCRGVCLPKNDTDRLFQVRANTSTYYRDDVEVSITASSLGGLNTNIRGFSVMAVRDDDTVVGSFQEQRDVVIASCDELLEGDTAFHSLPSLSRHSLTLRWSPNRRNYGRIRFRVWVVVRHYEVYLLESDHLTNEFSGKVTIPISDNFNALMLRVFNISNPSVSATTSDAKPVAINIGSNQTTSSSITTHVNEYNATANNSANFTTSINGNFTNNGKKAIGNATTAFLVSFSDGKSIELHIPTLEAFENSFEARLSSGFDLDARNPFENMSREIPSFGDIFMEQTVNNFLDFEITAPFAANSESPFLQSFGNTKSQDAALSDAEQQESVFSQSFQRANGQTIIPQFPPFQSGNPAFSSASLGFPSQDAMFRRSGQTATSGQIRAVAASSFSPFSLNGNSGGLNQQMAGIFGQQEFGNLAFRQPSEQGFRGLLPQQSFLNGDFTQQSNLFGQQRSFGGLNSPLSQQNNPFIQQANPFTQQNSFFSQQNIPFNQQNGQFGQQINPFGQQANSFSQQNIPFGQQFNFGGQQNGLFGQQPAVNNPISQFPGNVLNNFGSQQLGPSTSPFSAGFPSVNSFVNPFTGAASPTSQLSPLLGANSAFFGQNNNFNLLPRNSVNPFGSGIGGSNQFNPFGINPNIGSQGMTQGWLSPFSTMFSNSFSNSRMTQG